MANAPQVPIRVALVGHSYIKRMDNFMTDPIRAATHSNLGMDPAQVNVRCFGLGGARVVPGYKDVRTQVNAAIADQRAIIVLHVGENDLNTQTPQNIVGSYQQLIQHILTFPQVQLICIGQLLVFPCHERHRDAVVQINCSLVAA